MKLSTDPRPLAPRMARVRRGTTLEQVREIWRVRADAKQAEIMDKYAAQHRSGGGREGLGVYSQYASRASYAKWALAVKLLESAGLPVDETTVRKLMRRS